MAKWIQKKPKQSFSKKDTIVEKLAKARGIRDLGEWYHPPSRFFYDPYMLENIDEVSQRIVKAIHKDEKIVILADIDADGVFACATMYNYLRELVSKDNLQYIHSQRNAGHGLGTVVPKFAHKNVDGIVKFVPEDTDLLIIVDSSANSVEECEYVKEEMGIDILIIDHHEIDRENPHALMVNCQMGNYPNKYLSGSAMAWKVCHVLDEYMGLDFADNFLDLATIGLISDMMNVRENENRRIIYQGLANINNLGLRKLLTLSKVDMNEDIDTTTISFKISPAVNSCTRFDRIELALELMTCDDEDKADELAKTMIKLNDQRKSEESEIVESALEKVNNKHNVAILIDNEIGSGFRGLVAMQLVSKLNKPVFVLTHIKEKGVYGGSARGFGNLPLKEICEDSGLFNFAQGHSLAFGLEFDEEKLDEVFAYFDEILDEDDFLGEIYYDLELDESEITDFDIKEIQKFSRIVGQGFKSPLFKVTGLTAEEKTTKKLGDHVRAVLGADRNTVKLNMENDWALMKFRTNEGYAIDVEIHFGENFVTMVEAVGQINLNNFYNYGTKQTEITKQIFLEEYKII